MSDTTIAILILPVLIALTLVLECTRVGCTRLARKLREARSPRQGMQSQNLHSSVQS